ncbi:bifunctional hydroxymethylpyrimidine kinase/phosphomethylpyrimidine kinase [Sedimenticola hydrogenitrophicus]|uniref:bifunctional hydroxymethylpyrimidine kinase/phosphomethylpyrimidine kinase n=1 Tax=Sedimenticola hydrogenitrophicus TaxID=2967975 RepID=UPI0021A8B972|nr:hydroxymethylpyrimidine/phosphomethylpyrimidine kinase [Sedimenticola hydrogenitrophicus]
MQTIPKPIIPKPIVLSIAGHDPSGGAGIQADIETLAALGCQAATVITCLTIQDSRDVHELIPLQAALITRQVETLFQDYPISAIKIGLIGSAEAAVAIADLLARHPHVSVVVDPILAAGGGTQLAGKALLETLLERILPRATVVTPNSQEARRLTQRQQLDECADALLARGCQAVLITGTHEAATDVVNTLYRPGVPHHRERWPRLTGSYHGSGCTIASAIAAGLARGVSLVAAVSEAQRYTWESLSAGWQPGRGQHIPNRLYRQSSE